MKEDSEDDFYEVVRPVDEIGKSPVQIIKEAMSKNFRVWSKRYGEKENLSEIEVKELVNEFPDTGIYPNFKISWTERKSDSGPNAENAEKDVFEIEYIREVFGKKKKYYFKGYLYDEGRIIGVEFQSAREVK